MSRPGDYAIFRNKQATAQGQIRLSAGESTTVANVFAGSRFTAAFFVDNPDTEDSVLRFIHCVIPPSRLAISESCPNGVAAFVVKNVSTTTIRLVEYGFSNVTTSASLNSGTLEALKPGESRTISPTQGQHGIVQLGIHDVDDCEIRAERITCTQSPKLTVTASCPDGIATFVVTNVGLGGLSNTTYFITTHNPFGRRQYGSMLELKVGQSTTITAPGGGGAYKRAKFSINVGVEPVSAEPSC
jgi:hypothetical protein